MKNNLSERENSILDVFESFIENNSWNKIWRHPENIASIVGWTDVSEMRRVLEESNRTKRNSKGMYSTEYLYVKFTPFCQRLRDQICNRII